MSTAKKKKRKPERFVGLRLVACKGQAYLIAQGIEQAEGFDGKEFVEVGAPRTVAFKIKPSDAVHIACGLLLNVDFHLKDCAHCNELVIQTVVDTGVLQEGTEDP